MPEISIRIHGPILGGAAPGVIRDLVNDILAEVGGQGLANVQHILDQSIRNPTPYYETQVIVQRVGQDEVVHDRGVVYGPWLEGVGSRNRTTRFKGYHSFRKAAQELRQQIPALADPIVDLHMRRLG
jgi:hypothetical protein